MIRVLTTLLFIVIIPKISQKHQNLSTLKKLSRLMEHPRPKRNYIRRKKSLNDSMTLIRSTLNLIHTKLGKPESSENIDHRAHRHATEIEAFCRSHQTRLFTDDIYQSYMVAKTRELCLALIRQNLPETGRVQIMDELKKMGLIPTEPGSQRITFPVPILTQKEGERKAQSFETVGEFQELTLEQSDIFYDEEFVNTA
jgi:hypothetical protein